ncbi:MAG: AEC family transporter [Pseudomonadota bacterium]
MGSVAIIALPFFAVIAAGFFAARWRLLDASDSAALQRFAFNVAMPPALFGLTARAAPFGAAEARLALAYVISIVLIAGLAYGVARRGLQLDAKSARVQTLVSLLGNAVFLGLPIALSVPGWGEPFLVLVLLEGVLVFGLGVFFLDPDGVGRWTSVLTAPLRSPILAALISGLGFSIISGLTGVSLPPIVVRILDILGAAGGPAALAALGVFLATTSFPAFNAIRSAMAAIIAVKLAALPLLAYGMLHLLGGGGANEVGALLLFCAMPSGVAGFILANRYGAYAPESAAAIGATTILSLVSIALILRVFA